MCYDGALIPMEWRCDNYVDCTDGDDEDNCSYGKLYMKDFQQCGMCDQQRLRPACAYAQTNQSLYWPLEYPMTATLSTALIPFGVFKLKKETAQACPSLHLSKCHIVGNHKSQPTYIYIYTFYGINYF